MEDLTHIQVFKTDVKTEEDKSLLKALFDNDPAIEEWSVDCDDIDCVLRVVSHTLNADEIINRISKTGFQCLELE